MSPLVSFPSVQLDESYRGIEETISKCLREPVAGFVSSMDQVASLASLPGASINMFMPLFSMLIHETLLYVRSVGPALESDNTVLFARVWASLQQSMMNIHIPSIQRTFQEKKIDENLLRSASDWFNNVPPFETLNKPFAAGRKAMFSALVTGSWTAFEALLGDLWEAVVNEHPGQLGALKGDPKVVNVEVLARLKKAGATRLKMEDVSGSRQDLREEQKSKDVPLTRIIRFSGGSCDLSKRMGTVLRGRYQFSALGEARKAYGEAFKTHEKGIVGALADTSIDALKEVRNLIVHHAGKANVKYILLASGTAAPKIAEGECLELDDSVLSTLINSVIKQAVSLIRSVDQWVKEEADGKHPQYWQ